MWSMGTSFNKWNQLEWKSSDYYDVHWINEQIFEKKKISKRLTLSHMRFYFIICFWHQTKKILWFLLRIYSLNMLRSVCVVNWWFKTGKFHRLLDYAIQCRKFIINSNLQLIEHALSFCIRWCACVSDFFGCDEWCNFANIVMTTDLSIKKTKPVFIGLAHTFFVPIQFLFVDEKWILGAI